MKHVAIRREPSRDNDTFYLIEEQRKTDPVFGETTRFFNEAECVQWIIEGQFENIIRILAITPDEGACRDVTEDIAQLICAMNPSRCSEEAIHLVARFKLPALEAEFMP